MTSAGPRPVALITGGSRGIGRAIVARFQRGGYAVAATSRTKSGANASGAELRLVSDVRVRTSVDEAVGQTVERLGRLDVVLHNAGLAGANSLAPDDDDELYRAILETNLDGAYYLFRAALPHLEDGKGRLIAVASVLGLVGVPDQTAYCAAKHGVVGLVRALALHLEPRGITVNALCPGWVRTSMAEARASELGVTIEDLDEGVRRARGAAMTEPEDVAEIAFALAGSDAAAITGQAIEIDGGRVVDAEGPLAKILSSS